MRVDWVANRLTQSNERQAYYDEPPHMTRGVSAPRNLSSKIALKEGLIRGADDAEDDPDRSDVAIWNAGDSATATATARNGILLQRWPEWSHADPERHAGKPQQQ